MIVERVPYYGWPKPTPTNAERIEAWRRKYQLVPIELQCAPAHPYGSDLIDMTSDNEPDIPCFESAPGTTYTEDF